MHLLDRHLASVAATATSVILAPTNEAPPVLLEYRLESWFYGLALLMP